MKKPLIKFLNQYDPEFYFGICIEENIVSSKLWNYHKEYHIYLMISICQALQTQKQCFPSYSNEIRYYAYLLIILLIF